MSYIWHCPCMDGKILFKTEKPFLQDGKIKCPICKNIYSFSELEKFNIDNIKKHFKKLD